MELRRLSIAVNDCYLFEEMTIGGVGTRPSLAQMDALIDQGLALAEIVAPGGPAPQGPPGGIPGAAEFWVVQCPNNQGIPVGTPSPVAPTVVLGKFGMFWGPVSIAS